MIQWQVQAEAALASATTVAAFMQLQWSWPIAESVHFIGLTLLLGSIAAWDLRLVGLMRDVPVAAFHRLVRLPARPGRCSDFSPTASFGNRATRSIALRGSQARRV